MIFISIKMLNLRLNVIVLLPWRELVMENVRYIDFKREKNSQNKPATLAELFQNTYQNFLDFRSSTNAEQKEKIKEKIRADLGIEKSDLV